MAGALLQHQHDWETMEPRDYSLDRDIHHVVFVYRCRYCRKTAQVIGLGSPSREECDVAIVRHIHES